MKKRDIYLPSLSTLLIFGLVVFLSCAHQNRVQDEFGNEVEESQDQISENVEGSTEEVAEGAAEETAEEVAQAEQTAEQAVDELAQSTENTATLEGEALPTDSAQATTDELGLPQDGIVTPSESDNLLGDTSSIPPSDTSAASGTDPLAIPPMDFAQSEPPTSESVPTESAPVETTSNWDSSSNAVSTPSYSGVSKAPSIPTQAVMKKGTLLNRFYFTRRDDSPAKVSELLYGNAGQSKNLKRWNVGSWTPGKVLYYSSPSSPDDNQMKSFYQEKNISPEEYTVERGDWLSKVAEKRLGHSKSWKEIAVINGMDSPDKIEVGQRLAIYPIDLQSAPKETEQLAQMDQEQPLAQAQPIAPPPVVVNEPPVQAQPELVPPAIQEPIEVPAEKPRAVAPTGNYLEQNLFFILIGGGILALLGALMLVNKRKKARADEFGEEGFPAPTKLKRK